MIQRLCVIGVGLIGGSFARALRQAGMVQEIIGCGRNADNLAKAKALGVIDGFETDPARAVQGADVVFVAVPLGAMQKIFSAISGVLDVSTVLTDAGSAKASVITDAISAFGSIPKNFVPGHPIAGTENSGVEASFPGLYENRRVILTPLPETDPEAVQTVRQLWQATGALVNEMSVEHHDEILAATSHLPHMLAFTLVDSLARLNDQKEVFDYAAGGFRDFTRIASSDPVMWRDICLANQSAILAMIDRFSGDLDAIRTDIAEGDSDRILAMFKTAKAARDEFNG
ncbi:MAG: prephenate dehydrogenase/arogenate dehydrogenase family protein [Gammaproteobacteria bacterium]